MRHLSFLFIGLSIVPALSGQDVINTVVGGGPSGISGKDANLSSPYTVAVDSSSNVYIAAAGQNRIFKLSSAGVITVVAGNGLPGYSGDGSSAVNAELNTPWGVAVDAANPANVYIGDTANCLVRKVDQATGIITTIAGLVVKPANASAYPSCGYSGNGGKADVARLYGPAGIAVNTKTNDVYVAEFYNGIIRKIAGGSATGTITTVAGSGGSSSNGNNCGSDAPYGDGEAATAAYLCYPQGVALDNSVSPVNLLVSEYIHCDIREVVGTSGKIYQVAGSYSLGCGFKDKVEATSGQLNDPWQVRLSVSGATTTVDVADYSNARIRQFTLTYASGVPKPGTISTVGGKGETGFCGDGGSALSACMGPIGLAYDATGNSYIGDYDSERIRKITKSTNDINTVAGWGTGTSSNTNYSDPVGITESAGHPSLYYPAGVFADATSTNLYVGGYEGEAVYKYNSSTREFSNFAGNGVYGFSGDGKAADASTTELAYPVGIAKDSKGDIYIADSNNCAIREVSATTGDIATIAGGTSGDLRGCGYSGDGGAATHAQFNQPNGLAFDATGNLYIADYGNCAIRKITTTTGLVSTVAGGLKLGCGYSGDGGLAVKAKMTEPNSVSTDAVGDVFFSDTYNYRVREIVAKTGNIETVAGNGIAGYTGDGAASNELNNPAGVTSDANGNLFIADQSNHILRWVTPSGALITYAGVVPGSTTASAGFSGDGGPALKAQLDYPFGITRDSEGNTYVADQYNDRVREISAFAGYGLNVSAMPFPVQPAGTMSGYQPVVLSAVGPTTIENVTVPSGFSEVDDCVGEALIANESCEIDVYFQPTKAGSVTGNLSVTSNAFFASNPNTIALSGTAAGLALSGSLTFGTESLKTPLAKTVTLVNSGTAATITKIYLSETTDFSLGSGSTCKLTGGSMAANSSCAIVVNFNPQTVGAKKSTLVIASNDPASPILVGATGTGVEVATSAAAISFGTISYGTTATTDLTISNKGTTSFTLSSAITGTGFSISSIGKTCTTSVAASKSCVLPVEYKPVAVGTNAGTLTLTTNAGTSPKIALSGSAATDVSISNSSLAFGTITHATSKTEVLTIKNVGKITTLTVKAAFSGAGEAAYKVAATGNTCGSGVAAGKSCTLPVVFEPAAAASYSAVLTLTTNGGSNPTVSLSGAGK